MYHPNLIDLSLSTKNVAHQVEIMLHFCHTRSQESGPSQQPTERRDRACPFRYGIWV